MEKDKQLYDWLELALTEKQDVVYVSLGSIAIPQPWSINAIYKGLKNLKCKVVWSLADKWLPMFEEDPKNDPNFHIRGW